jgi:hypothetical protein
VLTCPDFSANDEIYTFEHGLGEGVPFLAQQHLEALTPLLGIKQAYPVEIGLVVLVADIESTNQALVNAYTDGDNVEFLRRCRASAEALDESYRPTFEERSVKLQVSSFLMFFENDEGETFLTRRAQYRAQLAQQFEADRSFHNRVVTQVGSKLKNGEFELEYRGRHAHPPGGGIRPYVDRELTTMAEFVTLGALIREHAALEGTQPFIVVHSEMSHGLLNDMRPYAPEHANTPAIPLLKRSKGVY